MPPGRETPVPADGRETPEGNWVGRVPAEGRLPEGEDGTRPALGREAPVDGNWDGRDTLPLLGRVAGDGRETFPLDGRE
jgi:hypothetical protein